MKHILARLGTTDTARVKRSWPTKVEVKEHNEGHKTPTFPPDFFDGSPADIAQGLHDRSTDLRQAMGRIDFYINRAGRKLSPSRRRSLDEAKIQLRALWGENVD